MNQERTLTKEEEIINGLMPESGLLADFVFGPAKRKTNETMDEYKVRRKLEARVLKSREKQGINSYDSKKHGTLRNPEKQKMKAQHRIKKENRVTLSRGWRKAAGIL